MIGLQAPLWLILLGIIPLIYWLHRFSQRSRTFPSTTLFLWRVFQHQASIDGAPARPDARWLLRALTAALMVLCLTDPSARTGQGPAIEVWVDDSLSMFTRENGKTRIQAAMEQLLDYLDGIGPARVRVHSLGNHASRLVLDNADAAGWQALLDEWTARPRGEPAPPPAASLSPDSNHVLISDGADSALNDWALSAPLQHIIRAGSAGRNLALTRLSLREPLNASDQVKALARIDNLGDRAQTVRLVLQQQRQVIETLTLDIPASGNTITPVTIPAGEAGGLQARIESPDDPLPLDDSLQLQPGGLYQDVRYAMPVACGRYVPAVLDAYPSLVRNDNKPDVIIDCSGLNHEFTQPVLRLHPARSVRRTKQPAHWHEGAAQDAPRLDAGVPYSEDAPALTSAATPILSADGRMLILKRAGVARVIDSHVDTDDPVFAAQTEYPLLILGLIARLTGQNLGFAPLTASRDIKASRIAPLATTSIPASPVGLQPVRTSLVPPLLFATLLLLLLDAATAYGLVRRIGKQSG